jgi:L-fuculose-phosphate aldolase
MDSRERDLRSELAAVCRRLEHKGLIAASDGNVSCRLGEDRILITPSGAPKGDVAPGDLLVTDLEGRPAGAGKPSSEIKMHLLVYRKRPDVSAVVHAHPPLATAFTVSGFRFDARVLPEVWLTMGEVPTAAFAVPSTEQVPRSIAPYVENHRVILLERHGALTYAENATRAYMLMEKLEHAARTMFLASVLKGRQPPEPLGEKQIAELEAVFGLTRTS